MQEKEPAYLQICKEQGKNLVYLYKRHLFSKKIFYIFAKGPILPGADESSCVVTARKTTDNSHKKGKKPGKNIPSFRRF